MYPSGTSKIYGAPVNSGIEGKGGKGGKGGKLWQGSIVSGFQPPNLYFQANPSQTVQASAENTEEHLVEHPPKGGDFELTNNCLIEYSVDADFDQDREKVMICYNLSSLPEIHFKKNIVRFLSTKIEGGKSVVHIVDKKNMYPSSEIFMNKVLKLLNINQSLSVYLNSKEGNASKSHEEVKIGTRAAGGGGAVVASAKNYISLLASASPSEREHISLLYGHVKSPKKVVANDLVFNPVLDCYVDQEGKCFYADLDETTLEPIPNKSRIVGKLRTGVNGEQAQESNFIAAKANSRKRKNRRNRTRKN